MAAATLDAVARSTNRCPTSATGARSQRPTQGARTTRTPAPTAADNAASSFCAPISSQVRLWHPRTVSAGGPASPSSTTATVDLLTKIVKMEEGHADWAEKQRAQSAADRQRW